jgi:hypothetical protein
VRMRKALVLFGALLGAFGCSSSDDMHQGASGDALIIGGGFRPPVFSPSVSIARIRPMQPGWLRVTLSYDTLGGVSSPTFAATTECVAGDKNRFSVKTAYLDKSARRAYLDLRAIYTGTLVGRCDISKLHVDMMLGSTVAASTDSAGVIRTEYDMAHLWPLEAIKEFGDIDQPSVSLTPPARRYAAYPPLVVGVVSTSGRVAFIEVEELPSRGTLGLRWMTTFGDPFASTAQFEIGGGSEIDDKFGLDVDNLGVTKDVVGLEISHYGQDTFGTGLWSPSMMTDPSAIVLPAPPRYPDAYYIGNVLDNRGLPRVVTADDNLDVIYDKATHSLVATNGAKVKLLELPPIDTMYRAPGFGVPRPLVKAALSTDPNSAPLPSMQQLSGMIMQMSQGQASPPQTEEDLRAWLTPIDATPLSGTAMPHVAVQRPPRELSPQELAIIARGAQQQQPNQPPNQPPPNQANVPIRTPVAYGCAMTDDATSFTTALTMCDGFTNTSGCPTSADPVHVESLARFPGTPSEVSVVSIMTPLRAGRVNVMGTCGTHADNQAFEAAMTRELDDDGIARVMLVDGLPVGVPEARLALSHAANLSHLYTWMGTQRDNRTPYDGAPWPSSDAYLAFPQFPDGVWPTREDFEPAWASHMGDFSPIASEPGLSLWSCSRSYWLAGFCTGQGTDPPSVYRSYSRMAMDATAGLDPLRDGIFSMANGYNPMQRVDIDMTDRDQAVFDVLDVLRHGLPVRFDFMSGMKPRSDVTPTPRSLVELDDITWYLPPEFAGCDFGAHYQPDGGHAVTLVGAVIRGPSSAPDPFQSFFVIENNWGADSGYRGYYAINFAAFKKFGWAAYTYHLARPCGSWACRN